MRWIKYENEDCYAIVTCKYTPVNSHHMELQLGDFVFIKEQYPGWYRGFKYSHPCTLRVFPNTHVKLLSSDIHPDLWAEIFSWLPNIRESYLLLDPKEFDQVCEAVQLTIAEKRFDNLQEKCKVTDNNRKSLVSRMEGAKKILGLPIESRNDKAEKLSLKSVSTLDLYSLHNKVHENNRNISGQYDVATETTSMYIKMLNINFDKAITVDESLDVIISLYKLEDRTKISRLSETYMHRAGICMNECDLRKSIPIVTKFVQFIPNHKIFLVFQFVRIGKMLTKQRNKREVECKFRRPQGVSVLEITSTMMDTPDTARQIGIQLMTKEESIEGLTERLILDYRTSRSDYRSTISIMFKMIRPEEFSDRYTLLHGLSPYYPPPIKSKRNCIYLTLLKADIDRGGKKSDPNFEIEVSIRDDNGALVSMPKDDWREIGTYKSVIYYHMAKPRWNELLCIPLFDKLDRFPPNTHVRFVIWHRSLNDRGKNPCGVAFLRLFPKTDSKAVISNKEHELTIYKLDQEQIKVAKYLRYAEEGSGSMESLTGSIPHLKGWTLGTLGKKAKSNPTKDSVSIQTLLISNEYTFDDLLANVCCNTPIDSAIWHNLCHQEVMVKNIDVNELKKFAIKILESSLHLLQQATDSSLLGRNVLILLGEMFKAIKNLPDYQAQINKFINETMNFKVHKQILHELINHVPEIDSNTLRASDWFMKIVVKSFQNMEAEQLLDNSEDAIIFNNMVDQYLQKLECWAKGKENKILRSIVLSKAGPIINALLPVSRPIGMAKLVNNLLEASQDLDAISKSGLTMDCMNSRLFLEPDCRKIILPETTRNMLDLFSTQLNKIYHGRELDQDHMLDNICEKMVEFMQLHERSWSKSTPETADGLVYELLIEHNMLRSCISIVHSGLDFLRRDDASCRLLYKPLMVLVSVIITSLSFLSLKLWQRLIVEQTGRCDYCGSKQMTNNYDMITELLSLMSMLQVVPVFPDCAKSDEEGGLRHSRGSKLAIAMSEVVPRQHRLVRQPWLDMLFVQSRQFLTTVSQIHKLVLRPHYLHNITEIQKKRPISLCCCFPSEKMQSDLVNSCVECTALIITQGFLKLEELPPSSALRIMHNSRDLEGDIRLWGSLLIKEMWHDLGTLKITFSQFFFDAFAMLTTIQNYKIRLLAVECMFDIVHLDHDKKKTELITQIDQAMEKADSSYCEEMSRALKEVLNHNTLQYAEDSQLVEHIMLQMNNIQECSQHLNDNSPINGMIVINNLRKFYQKMGRSDIIGRYLFKLMAIHSKIKNFTEMGYTLLELSSFYRWSHDPVRDTFFPLEYHNCVFEWQLKAQLLEESLKYFEKEDWEQGIDVCKELVDGYMNFLVDFVKLSEVHKKMSELFKKIMYEDRSESQTYVVFYIGLDFPKFITELPHKSIVLTTKRNASEVSIDLNSQFKNTTVEKRFPSDTDTKDAEKKIFFMPVKSNKFDIPTKYEGKFVRQRILKYFENYKIDEFVFKRLLNNTEEDPKKRKIEGCVIKCDGMLPNILSVAPVRSLWRETIDPFSEALHDLENQIRKDDMLYQDFEMALPEKRDTMHQKMIDVILKYISPVSGGVTKLVEMIPERDENKLSHAGDVVSRVFSLIFQFLETFEIYDSADSYNIFVSEFRRIIKAVSVRLDICEEDFNINPLLEQFNRSIKQVSVGTTVRKMSIVTRSKHDDDGQLTISRKTKLFMNEAVNEGRLSATLDEEHLPVIMARPRTEMSEPALPPKRQSSASDAPLVQVPPLPPKPRFSISPASQPTPIVVPPPKPEVVVCNDISLEDRF